MNEAAVNIYDAHPGNADLQREVLRGLDKSPKSIPPKFFYDRRGSELFDAICEQPEYYQTRTEMDILRLCVPELVGLIGSECLLVELGSGASRKVRLLLEQLRPSGYVGVDISREFLLSSTRRLATDYPWLEVHAACVDFSHALDIPHCEVHGSKLAFFPGSSIGNFEPDDAVRLMADVAALVGPGGHLLIGVDLKKDIPTLNAAYNDAAGITEDFNRNLLWRIRHELDCDLDPDDFSHYAFYNPIAGRIEMHLVSKEERELRMGERVFHFHAGESIHTENSYKYTVDEFSTLAERAGFRRQALWMDADRLFSVQLLMVIGNEPGHAGSP